ncbi:hypothetical protein B0H11DRAFT_2241170 [Mycena galericulata]|nr:hypothetical protein B0H11DRAFT_2241170 [Mycena galericulata]
MSTTHWCCKPIFRPSPGQEDTILHSNTADCWFYVVGKGYTNGIYTDPEVARDQVHRFSGGAWKKAPTWSDALKIWDDFCQRHHQHAPIPVIDLSPTPSPPGTPTPSSHPSPPPSRSPSPPPYEQRVTADVACATSCCTGVPDVLHIHNPQQALYCGSLGVLHILGGCDILEHILEHIKGDSSPLTRRDLAAGRSPVWYDAVDYVFENSMGTVRFLGSRNRRKVKAFVSRRPYVWRTGDPEESD